MSFFDDDDRGDDRRAVQRVEPLEVQRPAPSSSSTGLDLAGLSRLARELGPRDLPAVLDRAREIGAALGAVPSADPRSEGTAAYYRWQTRSRDGRVTTIEGPTIDLMDALAGEWGRLTYQIEILQEIGPRVTLRARVVDLVSLVIHERPYVAHLRPPPAKFARREDEAERWRVMQLQSAESKAIRGVLERVIPRHVIEAAVAAAREAASSSQLGTVVEGGRSRRRTLPEAIDAAVRSLAALQPPLPVELVEQWLGRPRAEWIASDLGALRSLYSRWRAGELTVERLRTEIAELGGEVEPEVEPTGPATSTGLQALGLEDRAPVDDATRAAAGRAASSTAGTSSSPSTDASLPLAQPERPTRSSSRGTGSDPRPALLERLEDLRRSYPQLVATHSAPYGRITGRTAAATIEQLVRTIEQEVERARREVASSASTPTAPATAQPTAQPTATAQPSAPSGEPLPGEPRDHWPTGQELRDEVRELAAEVSSEQLADALRKAGIPQIDGAPEPALQRLLVELLDLVTVGEL